MKKRHENYIDDLIILSFSIPHYIKLAIMKLMRFALQNFCFRTSVLNNNTWKL